MKKLSLSALLCVSFFLAAHAEDGSIKSDASGVHVDVKEVVAAGTVAPVDGITSSGQPDAEALRVFAESGYVAVIDMRGPDENRGLESEQAAVEALGMEYIPFPITNQNQISFDKARQLDEVLQSVDGPVLLHCGSGNRVGAVLALRHSLDGATMEESIEYGTDAGLTKLESVVRKRLAD